MDHVRPVTLVSLLKTLPVLLAPPIPSTPTEQESVPTVLAAKSATPPMVSVPNALMDLDLTTQALVLPVPQPNLPIKPPSCAQLVQLPAKHAIWLLITVPAVNSDSDSRTIHALNVKMEPPLTVLFPVRPAQPPTAQPA